MDYLTKDVLHLNLYENNFTHQNYWVFGLCPSSGILKTREHKSKNPVILSVIHHCQKPSETTSHLLDNPMC
jgi:hypothetical protein